MEMATKYFQQVLEMPEQVTRQVYSIVELIIITIMSCDLLIETGYCCSTMTADWRLHVTIVTLQ